VMKEPVLSQGILDVIPHTDAHRKWVWFMCLLSDFLAPKFGANVLRLTTQTTRLQIVSGRLLVQRQRFDRDWRGFVLSDQFGGLITIRKHRK
jgi:hypothetical protein